MTDDQRKKLKEILDNPPIATADDIRFSKPTDRGCVYLHGKGELEFLLSNIRKPPMIDNLWIVEIGTGKAGTTTQMAAYSALNEYGLKVMTCSVDHRPEIDKELALVKDYINVVYYNTPNRDVWHRWQIDFPGAKIWFLFLDGSHNYAHVCNDLWAAKPYLISDARIAVHDTQIDTEYGQAETRAMEDFCAWNKRDFELMDKILETTRVIRRK